MLLSEFFNTNEFSELDIGVTNLEVVPKHESRREGLSNGNQSWNDEWKYRWGEIRLISSYFLLIICMADPFLIVVCTISESDLYTEVDGPWGFFY